jgi:hypothetical protein
MNRIILGIFTTSLATGFVIGYVVGKYFTIRVEKVNSQVEDVNLPATRTSHCSS